MPIGSPASVSRYSNKTVQLEPTEQKKPETKLWRAVLGQVVYDAFGPDRYDTLPKDRNEAINFLKDYTNEDFIVLCENAGFDPEYIKRKVRKKFAEKFVSAISKLSTKVRNKNE
jgi:hypothetical protein